VNRLPNFLIIGAGKSGTTSLDNYLKQHPDIFMSPVKEPNFFAYQNIDISKLGKDTQAHYESSVTNIGDYYDLFKKAGSNQTIGETSNTYLSVNGTAKIIREYIPDVKLIAILRQPTKRLYSRYLHLARENKLPTTSFEDVLNKNTIWWSRNDLVNEGFYWRNLKPFYDEFPHGNIKIILYEDLKNNLQDTLNEIFEFLNLTRSVTIDISIEFNKSGFIKNKFFDKTLGHNSIFKSVVKKALPYKSYDKIKNNRWLQKKVNYLRNQNLQRPELDPLLYQTITDSVYKNDIKQLQDLIKKDLSTWL